MCTALRDLYSKSKKLLGGSYASKHRWASCINNPADSQNQIAISYNTSIIKTYNEALLISITLNGFPSILHPSIICSLAANQYQNEQNDECAELRVFQYSFKIENFKLSFLSCFWKDMTIRYECLYDLLRIFTQTAPSIFDDVFMLAVFELR